MITQANRIILLDVSELGTIQDLRRKPYVYIWVMSKAK